MLTDDIKLEMWVMNRCAKITQSKIADTFGVSQSTVSHWVGRYGMCLELNGVMFDNIDNGTRRMIDTLKIKHGC